MEVATSHLFFWLVCFSQLRLISEKALAMATLWSWAVI
jgi:hypothetical protein